MADLLTFELTTNGKAVKMKTNMLEYTPDIDYAKVTIAIDSICHIVQEENNQDGINITLKSGIKHTVSPFHVTKVGAKTYTIPLTIEGLGDFLVCGNNDELVTDLFNLIGW